MVPCEHIAPDPAGTTWSVGELGVCRTLPAGARAGRRERVSMPRPPEEIRRIDDELRRRERAHRRLRWERRLRTGLWLLGGAAALGALLGVARLAGLPI